MEPDATPPPALVRISLARRVFNYPLVQALIGSAMILAAMLAVSALGSLLGIVDGPCFFFLGVLVALSVVLHGKLTSAGSSASPTANSRWLAPCPSWWPASSPVSRCSR